MATAMHRGLLKRLDRFALVSHCSVFLLGAWMSWNPSGDKPKVPWVKGRLYMMVSPEVLQVTGKGRPFRFLRQGTHLPKRCLFPVEPLRVVDWQSMAFVLLPKNLEASQVSPLMKSLRQVRKHKIVWVEDHFGIPLCGQGKGDVRYAVD